MNAGAAGFPVPLITGRSLVSADRRPGPITTVPRHGRIDVRGERDRLSGMSHRPTLYGSRHAVSAGHYLAAAAGFVDPRGRRQRDRCRLRRRHRAGRAASRRGECRRRGADHDPHGPARNGQGRHHRRPRPLARALPGRPVHARARRQDAARHPAHRGAGRARRLDHRAARLRHDDASATSPAPRSATPARASPCSSTWRP